MSGECDSCGEDCFSCKCEWISVKDRLPDCEIGLFLVYALKGTASREGIFCAFWKKKLHRFEGESTNCGCTGFGEITHWMPLPSPPKEPEQSSP